MRARPSIGFFGKMPTHGDFVRRNLAPDLAGAWDDWLGPLMTTVRRDLGEADWLDVYLTSPVWRFALGARVAGVAQAGVLVPSVDRVGRYFPLVIALPLTGVSSLVTVARDGGALFDALEALALRALEDDTMDAGELARELSVLTPPWVDTPEDGAGGGERSSPGVWTPLGDDGAPAAVAALAWLLADLGVLPASGGDGLWWTEGSAHVPGGLLRSRGWPTPRAAVALFDGRWRARGWSGLDPVAAPLVGLPDREEEEDADARWPSDRLPDTDEDEPGAFAAVLIDDDADKADSANEAALPRPHPNAHPAPAASDVNTSEAGGPPTAAVPMDVPMDAEDRDVHWPPPRDERHAIGAGTGGLHVDLGSDAEEDDDMDRIPDLFDTPVPRSGDPEASS